MRLVVLLLDHWLRGTPARRVHLAGVPSAAPPLLQKKLTFTKASHSAHRSPGYTYDRVCRELPRLFSEIVERMQLLGEQRDILVVIASADGREANQREKRTDGARSPRPSSLGKPSDPGPPCRVT